ncbi:hypothetical protein N7535_001023 [Penicillium sp. DV-2018c]|nr:hypothetical protein N7535_001023 [Penicillium sp. DV-2018c]
MNYHLDSEAITERQAMAKVLDSNELLDIVGYCDYISRINDTFEIGERPYPADTHVHDLGDLSRLNVHVLQEVVERLDLRSALKFSLVNRYAHQLVDRGSVTFLKKWAPELPKALAYTRVIRYWEISQLKDAIRSSRCVSCGELGKYIWLATMERCCPWCMMNSSAYCCLDKAQTTAAFALPLEEMKKICPIFVTVPSDECQNVSTSGFWAYPIKHTLARALEIYGSIEAVKAAAVKICAGQQNARFADIRKAEILPAWQYDLLRAAQLKPLSLAQTNTAGFVAPMSNQSFGAVPHESFFPAAIVPHAQTQLITYECRGCKALLWYRHIRNLDDQDKTLLKISLSSTAAEAYAEMHRRAFRIWTSDDMIDHIRSECLGGWCLVYDGWMPLILVGKEPETQA